MTRLVLLPSTPTTPENFAPFGELIAPSPYGKVFGPDEAQLDLSQGQPRLYIMRSPFHGLEFTRITRHKRVTQCLGARNDRDWFIAVATPETEPAQLPHALKAFHLPGETSIKLHRGSWHAGPFFRWDYVDFYNLELTDTNHNDSEHVNLAERFGLTFGFDELTNGSA